MPRFYVDMPLACGQEVTLPDSVVHHVHVLRLRAGDTLTLFNGQGGEYHAALLSVSKRGADVMLTAFDPVVRESPLQLTIVQALSAAERMDYTMQKATECGAWAVQTVISSRCQYRLQGERAQKKLLHWQAIAISAGEQCGRTGIPSILPIQSLSEYLAKPLYADLKILLSPTGSVTFAALPEKAQSVHVLIGPEGGLTQEEETAAIAGGFTPVILGPRIFRTETVAPVIAGLLQLKYGDFR